MFRREPLRARVFDSDYLVMVCSMRAHGQISRAYARGRMLDIGCGDKPMRAFFADLVSEHVGVDHAGSLHDLGQVDVVASAYDTKQPPNSFDTVLCTAVLEHLEEPEAALREAFRVLKPGGHALYTVPLFWHLHEEPRDFYRFTKHGLRHLFEKAGFEVRVIHPCGGYWVTAGSMFGYYAGHFGRGILRYPVAAIRAASNLLCLGLERLHKAEEFTWMYLVVARKP